MYLNSFSGSRSLLNTLSDIFSAHFRPTPQRQQLKKTRLGNDTRRGNRRLALSRWMNSSFLSQTDYKFGGK